MNKEKALKAFVDALKPYLLNVEFHECFIDELREILLKHKGCEATLLRIAAVFIILFTCTARYLT